MAVAGESDAVAPESAPSDEAWDEENPPEDGQPADAQPLGYESAAHPDARPVPAGGGAWTIPMLCLGIGLIACCLLIPLADSNRRLAYERQRLRTDLESLQTQAATNDEFLRRVHDDPTLAERLAQRQMKQIREGTRILTLKGVPGASGPGDVPPFQIVAVPPPPPAPPYRPVGGTIADLCYNAHTRLYVMGAGLLLMAGGLVLGITPRRV